MGKYLTDWEWLMIRVLLLGLTVFMWSFITDIDGVLELFGDTLEKRSKWSLEISKWGFRHYVYTATFTIITGIQAAKIIKWVDIRGRDDSSFPIKNK